MSDFRVKRHYFVLFCHFFVDYLCFLCFCSYICSHKQYKQLKPYEKVTFFVRSAVLRYDMFGRKLNFKPTQKGIYINNGKKVVIE